MLKIVNSDKIKGTMTVELNSSALPLDMSMDVPDDHQDVLRDILDKTRQMGRAIQNRREGDSLDYARLAKVVSEFSRANVYMVGGDGKVLGHYWVPEYKSNSLSNFIKNGYMPEDFVEKMNLGRELELCDGDTYPFDDDADEESPKKHLMYVPICGASAERLGTVMLVRFEEAFTIKDILMAEYLGTLVGLEMLNDRNRTMEGRSRDKGAVQMAMRALSYSEMESMKHIMAEIEGFEGVAIASKVADRVGVTRSVIVNALRKLESAGLIESRSLGMKGTYIKVLSPLFVEELGIAADSRVTY
ncbi:GTP-sensing transcriptional pleiotropic repressor CodY [Synergistales bacterium]|nr:GTP-sensing transcriptional pleiotropic repressor CodY [Synergistales bacterium]